MARINRDFSARPADVRNWLLQETWCDVCAKADLGICSPREYEENGRVYVEGECLKCGQQVRSEITEKDAS